MLLLIQLAGRAFSSKSLSDSCSNLSHATRSASHSHTSDRNNILFSVTKRGDGNGQNESTVWRVIVEGSEVQDFTVNKHLVLEDLRAAVNALLNLGKILKTQYFCWLLQRLGLAGCQTLQKVKRDACFCIY